MSDLPSRVESVLDIPLHAGEVVRKGRAAAFLRAEGTVDGVVVVTAQVTKTLLR